MDGDVTYDYDHVERAIEATILSIICALALIGNTSLWIIIVKVKKLRTTSNALILCLSAADLLVSLINMPVIIFCIVNGERATEIFVGGDGTTPACTFLGLVNMMTFVGSVMSLGAISLNRYALVCHPSKVKDIYTKRNTGLIIAGVWLITFILSMPPLAGWSTYAYRQSQSFCFADWRVDKSYAFFMIAMCFGGPCSIMTFSYFNILREVKKSKQRVHGRGSAYNSTKSTAAIMTRKPVDMNESYRDYLSTGTAGAYHNKNNSANTDTDQEAEGVLGEHEQTLKVTDVDVQENGEVSTPSVTRKVATPATDLAAKRVEKHRKEEMRLTLSFFVVIVTFVICWLPFVITMFTYMYLPSSNRDNSSGPNRVVDMCTLLLGCMNSSCNPIIYGVMNRNFRAAYKKLFCHSCVFWSRHRPSGTGSGSAST